MAKNKKTNRQVIVQNKQHRKLKTKQHEHHLKLGLISQEPHHRLSLVVCKRYTSFIITKTMVRPYVFVRHMNSY